MQDSPPSSEEALHSSLLTELRRKATATDLQPTLILERDSLGRSHLISLHQDESEIIEEGTDEETGIRVYQCVIEEPVQDNLYELVLDFDRGTFQHRYKKTAYEGGDGFYETIHRGGFSIESSGAGKKTLPRKASAAKKVASSPTLGSSSEASINSPRKHDPVKYYVAKVEVRDYTSHWEPWDERMATEDVRRVGDQYHQELLFRYVNSDEIVNENISPACPMRRLNV